MSSNNGVEHPEHGQTVNGDAPRILQEHSIAVKYDVRDQLVKLKRFEALKKFDEEVAAAKLATAQNEAPTMAPPATAPEASMRDADRGRVIKGAQGGHKSTWVRELWHPRFHGRQQNLRKRERRSSILYGNQIWYGELYQRMYGSYSRTSPAPSSIPDEESNDATRYSDYGTGSIARSEPPHVVHEMPQYQPTAPQYMPPILQAYSISTAHTDSMPNPQSHPIPTFPQPQVMQMCHQSIPLQFDPHLAMYLFSLNPKFFEDVVAHFRNAQQAPALPSKMFAEAGVQTDQVSIQPVETASVESIATQTIDEKPEDNANEAGESDVSIVLNETETVGQFEMTPTAEETGPEEHLSISDDVTSNDSLIPTAFEEASDFADVLETAQNGHDENEPIVDAATMSSTVSSAEPTRELSKSTIARQRRRDNQKAREAEQAAVNAIEGSLDTSPVSETPHASKNKKASRTKSSSRNDKEKLIREKPAKQKKSSTNKGSSTSGYTLQKDRQEDADKLNKISKLKKRTQAKNLRKAVRNTHEKTSAKSRSSAVRNTVNPVGVKDSVEENGKATEKTEETNDSLLNVAEIKDTMVSLSGSQQSIQADPTCSAFRPFKRSENPNIDGLLLADSVREADSGRASIHPTDAVNVSEEASNQESREAASEPSQGEHTPSVMDAAFENESEKASTILVDKAVTQLEENAVENSGKVTPEPSMGEDTLPVMNTASASAVNDLEKHVATEEVVSEPRSKKNKKHSGAQSLGNPRNAKLVEWAKNKVDEEKAEERAGKQKEDSKPGCSNSSKLTEKQMGAEVKKTKSPVVQDVFEFPSLSNKKHQISPEEYREIAKQKLLSESPQVFKLLDKKEMETVVDCQLYADALRAIKTPYDIFHVKGAPNRHLSYDTTGLLEKFVEYKNSRPLMLFTEHSKPKCQKYLMEQLSTYGNSRTPTEAKLEGVFKTILAYFMPDFYQDLECLATLHSNDAQKLEVHEKFLDLFESTVKFQSENQCIAYWQAKNDSIPEAAKFIGAKEQMHLSIYNRRQLIFRCIPEQEIETHPEFKTLSRRQWQMIQLGRTRNSQEDAWTSENSKEFLSGLRDSAEKLEDPAVSRLYKNCYEHLLTKMLL
ncbi:hypothetical protein CAEBREN_15583 [Caenorhabditis brenneri]|uniref:Uncharacterized protein n=1 Tax=Caenorhabditis brenneri TaxID=135651 RepID=G0MW96_CAEBE|nr:hypothetical protein CAEBREN_15583 [Caenorhabditis brenneri]